MKNKILLVFTFLIFGLPGFCKSNFSYEAAGGSDNVVAYHAQNVQYNTQNQNDEQIYQLQANSNLQSSGTLIADSRQSVSSLGTIASKGDVDYITMPSKQNSSNFGRTAGVILGMAAACAVDPYIVEIDGNKYIMILDNFDGIYNENDIIGINDSKYRIFSSLKKLDVNGNKSKLTSQELKDRGVRFVKIDKDGRLAARDYTQDYPLDNIVYIDLTSLKKIKNNNPTGIFGEFKIFIKNGNGTSKDVKGFVTYELHKDLVKLF